MPGKTVVILGGGTGGLVAANRLRSMLGREHRIVVIDRRPDHIFYASLLWVMVGTRRPENISRPLARLNRKGIDFHQAAVNSVDLPNRCVQTGAGRLSYDYLLISLGAETAMETIPGLAEAGHNLYELNGITRLNEALTGFQGGRIAILVNRLPYKCPAAPFEAALLLDYLFRKRGIRNRVSISIHTPEPRPMPAAGPQASKVVAGLLAQRDIEYFPDRIVDKVLPGKALISFQQGAETAFDLLLAVPPHRSPGAIRQSGLTDETGWLPVDPGTMETRTPGVYAVGDITAIRLPSGIMLPKAGVFAHYQAEAAAHNLAAVINGRAAQRRFRGHGFCILETGQGKAGLASGNFYAEPAPAIRMQGPGRIWHWGKVGFEKWWLWRWF